MAGIRLAPDAGTARGLRVHHGIRADGFRPERPFRLAIFLVLAVAVLGCGGDGERADADSIPVSGLVPELRIGSPDDPDYAFGTVTSLEVGPDGEIYSIHQRESSIRRWNGDGAPLGAIGRAGDGPGEMRTPRILGWRGDTLWVFDSRGSRITFFSAGGTYLRALNPVVDLGSVEMALEAIYPPRPAGLLGDGSIYGVSSVPSDEVVRGRITHVSHIRMDSTGAVTDTVATVPLGVETVLGVLEDGGGVFTQQPFGDGVLNALTRDGLGLVLLERTAARSAGAAEFRVTRLGLAGDTVFSRGYPYVPVRIPAERVDSAISEIASQLQEFVGERRGTTVAQWRGWLDAAAYKPDYHTPVSQLVTGRDGSVWLALYPPGEGGIDWLVLNESGEPVRRVRMPSDLRVLLADHAYVWGVETDELDVPYIVRYRVSGDPG